MTLLTAVAARDGDFSPNPKSFSPGYYDFNDPKNWVQQVVPTGVANIATPPDRAWNGTIVFQAASTTLSAINLQYGSMAVDLGHTVTLTGGGVDLCADSTTNDLAVDGILNGNVLVRPSGRLRGIGTINGDVFMQGSDISPVTYTYGDDTVGTLQINGDYVQGAPGAGGIPLDFTFRADPRATTASKLSVKGKAAIAANTRLYFLIPYLDPSFPKTKTFTVLTAAGGLSGTFGSVTIWPDDRWLPPVVEYTPDSVLATLTRR
jgi:hypothetical protein